MMIRPFAAPFLVVLAAAPVCAQDLVFDGLWRSDPSAACAYTGGDGSALKIEDHVLYGAETTCEMTNPVNVNEMEAILYNMECETETDSFQNRAMFMNASDGGLYLIWNGFAFKYEACEEEAPAGPDNASEEAPAEADAAE